MFGKRGNDGPVRPAGGTITAPPPPQQQPVSIQPPPLAPVPVLQEPARDVRPARPAAPPPQPRRRTARSEDYYNTKSQVFSALIDTIDLSQLAKLDTESAREEIRDIVSEIIALKNVVMSIAEQEELLEDICNDVLGYGPLEPLLRRHLETWGYEARPPVSEKA